MHTSRTHEDSEQISAIDWYNLVAEAVKDIRSCQKIQLSNVKLNSAQCSMLTTIFSSKLSKFWPQNLPSALCSTDGCGSGASRKHSMSRMSDSFEIVDDEADSFGALESCTHALKEVYRVVKELEAFMLACSVQDWWKSALFHVDIGEALAVHIHDLLWSVAALDVTMHHAKCCVADVMHAVCSRRFGEIYAEMSSLHHIINESTDKKQLISMLEALQAQFVNLSNRKKRTLRVEEENKYRISAYLLHKLKDSGMNFLPVHHHLPEGLSINHKDIDLSRRRLIGRGSFGQVYEASWFGMRVALKELPCGDSQLFKEEASILARLHSPFIVHLIGWSIHEEANVCHLVMELCSSNLRNHIDKRSKSGPPFSLRVAVDIMLQIARGMEYLHSERVIHRDLRASNVLVNDSTVREFLDEGHVRVKLCDFGMAKAKLNSTQPFSSMKGATYWRAPEVFSNCNVSQTDSTSNKTYTDKADVYSFAMTCYEILTGKIPFDGTLYKEIQEIVMRGGRPELPPSCPSLLTNYIRRCWDGDYRYRPSFKEICKVLRHVKLLLLRLEVPEDVIFQSVTTEFDTVDSLQKTHSLRVLRSGGRDFDNDILNAWVEPNNVDEGMHAHHSDVPSSQRTPRGGRMSKAKSFLSLKYMDTDPRDGILCSSIPCFITKFSLHDLRTATANFSERISAGKAGAVFRGILSDGTTVAVKVAEIQNHDDLRHFCIKAAALGNAYHVNVVRFRGYCVEADLYFLFVFDYMDNLSLDRWLVLPENSIISRDSINNPDLSPKKTQFLNWHVCFKIALGTARAVTFLHEDCGQCVLPIGLKSSKILLDRNYEPKISILSLTEEGRDCQYFVHKPVFDKRDSAVLAFSPEALDAQRMDVYNFGVILLEMADRQKLILQKRLSKEGLNCLMDQINLHTTKNSDDVVDWILSNQDNPETEGENPDEGEKANILLRTAEWCIRRPESRPSMNQVVQILEENLTILEF